MAFEIDLGFATEHDRDDFVERILPKLRGKQAEAAPAGEEDALHRVAVAVTSPSAARDLCHQLVAFLAHAKNSRVQVGWKGADGTAQVGEVSAGSARDAELVSVRVSAAAKALLDKEKV